VRSYFYPLVHVTCCTLLEQDPDGVEDVVVGVVGQKLDEDGSGFLVDPHLLHDFAEVRVRVVESATQVDDVAAAGVG
jgi:hypothetical protein